MTYNQLTHEQFIKKVKEKKIDDTIEILGEYINSHTKIQVKCKVCNHIWELTPNNLLRGRKCPQCRRIKIGDKNRKTNEQFLIELANKNPLVTALEEYKGDRVKIKCRCNICGKEFEKIPNHLLRGETHYDCGKEKTSQFKRSIGKKSFEEKFSKNPHKDELELLTEYYEQRTPLKVKCKKCGYIYETTAVVLMQGGGCPKCARTLLKTNEKFLQQLQEINPHLHPLDEYINAKTPIRFQCDMCGQIHLKHPNAVLLSKGYCPNTKHSRRETIIKEILTKNNINFIQEYKFDDCRNILPLRFDFYLPDINVCIEYDRIQHFRVDCSFGNNATQEEKEKQFEEIKKRDNIKTKYCLDNNIKLIRIKYWQNKNIEKILLREGVIS